MNGLQAQPLSAEGEFNWVFLVEILVTGILALFFLFYFNRLFATIVSYGIRAYTWHKYRAYIDINSLQISLLGGRIFFKSIQYHAHNITCFVYEGHVTWRYWLHQVQEAEAFQGEDVKKSENTQPPGSSSSAEGSSDANGEKSSRKNRNISDEETGGLRARKKLPCRIAVKVAGVEAFIYNRSPLYDGIVEAAERKTDASRKDRKNADRASSSSEFGMGSHERPEEFGNKVEEIETRSTRPSHAPQDEPQIPSFLRIFPIMVECKRAAAAVGNENTTNVLVAKVEKADGTIDAGKAGSLDLFKLLFQFDIENVTVDMKPNRDFKEYQLDAARRILREKQQGTSDDPEPIAKVARKATRWWQKLWPWAYPSSDDTGSLKASSTQSFVGRSGVAFGEHTPGQAPWHGLTRYLADDDANEADEWQGVEYAKVVTLVECPKVTMRFYWDIPGPVPNGAAESGFILESAGAEDVNGSSPPEYGMDLGVHGGFVLYGPWADRQRINLQQIFFPPLYADAVPLEPLDPGKPRLSTVFKINVVVEDNVVLRIPTREPSKDARWKGGAEKAVPKETYDPDSKGADKTRSRKQKHQKHRKDPKAPMAVDARPYGWLDIKVMKDSVVKYTQDMYPRSNGYRNALDIDVKGIEMESSVNHGLLWRSGSLTLEADLSYPLSWNSLREWPFKIVCDDVELFILRDHMFLIIDLVNDWASGPPPDFYTFVPFSYQLDMNFRNFCMYLNVNDSNIINDPANFERNDFLTLEGQLQARLGIPLEHYRPQHSQVTFDVVAETMSMRMLSPQRSTFSSFLKDKRVAELPKLTLSGSASTNTDTRPGLTDVLRLNIAAKGLTLHAYGFLVRQLVSIKENYFGDYLHFKTLEEFQSASENLEEANRLTASFPKPKSINELDVILCIVVEDSTVLFPTNLYSAQEFIRAEVPRADLDLRVASYYLDMGLNLSPVNILSGTVTSSDDTSSLETDSRTQIYISHVDLDGHRMFGLPPDEPAYVSEWNIGVGKVKGELSSSFVHDLASAGKALAFTINDGDNALPLVTPSIMLDATFVQVQTDIVRLWIHVDSDALFLSTDPISVESNDWASEMFSQRVSVLAPKITFACVDASDASRQRLRRQETRPVRTFAFLQTGVALDVLKRKRHFTHETRKQQAHIELSSQRTGRATFLRRPHIDAPIPEEDKIDFEPPAMCSPPLPPPLYLETWDSRRSLSIKSKRSAADRQMLSRKSSLSSLSASVKAMEYDSHPAGHDVSHASELHSRPTILFGAHHQDGHSVSPMSTEVIEDRVVFGSINQATTGPTSSPMAFSSPFSEPYFPLDAIEPDESLVPPYPNCQSSGTVRSETSSISETIEISQDDRDREHTTVLINIVPGIRAYVDPRIGYTVASLASMLVPRKPEEVLDNFHMDVMSTILGKFEERHGHESIVEIQASLPVAHIRIAMLSDQEDVSDQADIQLRGLESVTRIRHRPSKSGGNKILALHNTLTEMEATLTHPHDKSDKGPAISVGIDDVLLWLALADANSFHLSFRDTTVLASGSHTRNLCMFILRLLPIVTELQDKFEAMQRNHLRRLQLLTYTLTVHGKQFGDPPFTTRMVSTMLAFPDHFRNQDSWKILMRFRYIMINLPEDIMDGMRTSCEALQLECPEEAPQKTLESLTQWYNWDIPYVNQTLAFKKIFDSRGEDDVGPANPKPTAITFRSETLRIAIQDEKAAVEVLLEDTSVGVENTPPTIPEGLLLIEENTRTHTVVQMHTNKISISLDWSLLDIAEDVLSMKDELKGIISDVRSQDPRTASTALGDGLARHTFSLVLSTDTGKITLQSLNLRHVARSEGLQMSLIGTSRASEEWGQCISAIITCDVAVTELRGPTQRIWRTLLTSPKLYIDHLHPLPGVEKAPTITLAFGYKDVQLAVVEQVPGILHIVDSVVVDEVGRIQRLISDALPDPSDILPPSTEFEKALSANESSNKLSPKLHVALLAGQIHVSISLLQELSYQLEGTAASVRVAPDLTQDGRFTIDFDVGRQDHAFINTSQNERHTQGILQLPPINGNVELKTTDTQISVSVATTIDKIEVDAAAIQGVVGVINRPEVQDIISAIKSGIEDVQARVEDVFPTPEQPGPEVDKTTKSLLLDVRFALLGVRVSATTTHALARSTVEVEFGIGPLHATASNRGSATDLNPHFPEIRAKIQDIGARLYVKNRKGLHPCGHIATGLILHFNTTKGGDDTVNRELKVRSDELEVHAYPETASTLVDVVNHLQDKIKHLDLSKEFDYLRRIRDQRKNKVIRRIHSQHNQSGEDEPSFSPEDLLAIKTTIEFSDIRVWWLVDSSYAYKTGARVEDLVFSIARVEFTTRGGHEARLAIMDLQLQLAQKNEGKQLHSLNSALLPEVTFSVRVWSKGKTRSFAIKATGKPLDVRLESSFMLPVNALQKSIEHAIANFQKGTETWQNTPTTTGAPRAQVIDIKHLETLLVEADFAGATVYMQGSGAQQYSTPPLSGASQKQGAQHGRYGQFAEDETRMHTTLTSPGIAFKLEYNSQGQRPSVNTELRIDASSNRLLPNVVPLVLEISNSIKEVMQNQNPSTALVKKEGPPGEATTVQKFFDEDSLITASPAAIFGKTKVNLGVRVCKQEFGLTCQPIARVDASASIEDFYFTMNTIDSEEYGHFFAMSAVMTNMTAQVKHMYSREPTFSYDLESVVLSAMNTKHLSGTAGINAVLNINPTRLSISARQFQDLMLFREIWLPPEIRNATAAASTADNTSSTKPEEYLVQRYQTVAAAAAFPWNATVNIAKLTVDLDLGQSIGKSSFEIENLWASQQKSSNWEQNLCIGMDAMGVHSAGRMSGFVLLEKLGVRLSIRWPDKKAEIVAQKTPLIQASIGFKRLRAKAAYDYQAFAFADIEGFDFLMYNVRESNGSQDRLVALLDFAKAYVFCTSTSPAQAVGLYQAFDRLIQDKQTAYAQSLKDIEKHLRRESTVVPTRFGPEVMNNPVKKKEERSTTICLHTDVVVSLGALCFGIYPSTFFDSQMLKLEANTIQARFAVGVERGLITSVLSLTLGQLQVALASTRRVTTKPRLGDVSVDDVITNALNSKGGTILRVPKVVASMQTWQMPDANKVEYIFKSLFDGKIDVGWNLSRIDFIKGMWNAHVRSLASRIGKSLPESAVKITAIPPKNDESRTGVPLQEKITAEINLPQSRYEYTALEPPVIETPQLRDMGEATPPLEWIGLHRDRLPNVTHQIIIVSLLEMCKEVEDAYGRILGSSRTM